MSTQEHFERLRKQGLPLEEVWRHVTLEFLKHKTIADIRYMTDEEAEHYGWLEKPLVIFFLDGNFLIPSRDDEGNDGGSLFTSWEELPTIPTIRAGGAP